MSTASLPWEYVDMLLRPAPHCLLENVVRVRATLYAPSLSLPTSRFVTAFAILFDVQHADGSGSRMVIANHAIADTIAPGFFEPEHIQRLAVWGADSIAAVKFSEKDGFLTGACICGKVRRCPNGAHDLCFMSPCHGFLPMSKGKTCASLFSKYSVFVPCDVSLVDAFCGELMHHSAHVRTHALAHAHTFTHTGG